MDEGIWLSSMMREDQCTSAVKRALGLAQIYGGAHRVGVGHMQDCTTLKQFQRALKKTTKEDVAYVFANSSVYVWE